MSDVSQRSRSVTGRASRKVSWPISGALQDSALDEQLLVNQARAGSQVAFEALVQRYERPIYAFTYRMLGDPDDAFDLTQECFIRAYKNLHRTNPDLNFSPWLHRIASNACLDVLRRRQRIRWQPWDSGKHEPLLEAGPAVDPERVALAGENSADVQQVLDRMNPRNRLALVLREHEGLSTREIGEVMGLSRSAVKSVLFRGRDEFRRIYIELFGGAPLH
jgi:RNA polymerase sigma-70 factor, ECF subfamily